MMSLANDVLSNSLILSALLCGVIFGFAFTILVLHANDCRVFDAQGKYIPGPLTNLWGKNLTNVLSCARKAKKISLATCEELLNELGNGDIVAFNSMFGKQTVVVGHPELIKSVLSGHHLKFLKTAHMNRLKFFLGEGLFTSEGSRWQSHRQLIGSGFQSENLKTMIPNFNLQTQRIVKYWMSNINKLRKVDSGASSIPVNLKNDFHNLTMSIMCFSAFSYDFQSSNDRDTISAAFEAICGELNTRNNDPTDWWHMLYPTRTGSTKSALEVFHTLLDELINTRLVEYTNTLNRRLKRRSARRLQNLSSGSMSSNSNDEDLHGLKVIVNENTIDDGLHNTNNTKNNTSVYGSDRDISNRIGSFMHNPNEPHTLHTNTNNTHNHNTSSNGNSTHTNNHTTNTSSSSTAPPTFQRGSSATHTSTNGDTTTLHSDVSPSTHPNPHTTHNVHTVHNTTHTTNSTHTIPHSTSNTSLHGSSSNSVTSPYSRNTEDVENGSSVNNKNSDSVGIANHAHITNTTHTNTSHTANQHNTTHTNTNANANTTHNTTKRSRDLLDLLIHCGESNATTPSNKLSRTEIRDHLYTFLTTGHETTSACLQWTVYELCRHPEVQRRCQAEIDAVLRGSDSSSNTSGTSGDSTSTNAKHTTTNNATHPAHSKTLTFDHINKLSYLVQVLKESMRLHTIQGNIARECSAECSVGQYKLKPGTIVIVSTVAAHMHPDFWEDPNSFQPDRFSRENIRHTVKHPYQYIPFSAGPRSCIGQKFALMEVLVVLGNLLAHFTFTLAAKDNNSVVQEEAFSIHPKDLNVVVTLRSASSDSGANGTSSGGSGSGSGANGSIVSSGNGSSVGGKSDTRTEGASTGTKKTHFA